MLLSDGVVEDGAASGGKKCGHSSLTRENSSTAAQPPFPPVPMVKIFNCKSKMQYTISTIRQYKLFNPLCSISHRIVLDDVLDHVRPDRHHALLPTIAGHLRAVQLPDQLVLPPGRLLAVVLVEDAQAGDRSVALHAEVEAETLHLVVNIF